MAERLDTTSSLTAGFGLWRTMTSNVRRYSFWVAKCSSSSRSSSLPHSWRSASTANVDTSRAGWHEIWVKKGASSFQIMAHSYRMRRML